MITILHYLCIKDLEIFLVLESFKNCIQSSMGTKMIFIVLNFILIGTSIGQNDQQRSSMLQIFIAKISSKAKGKLQVVFCFVSSIF